MTFVLEDCTLAHIRSIIPKLRVWDRKELSATETAPRHALISLWRNSFLRRAYTVDGEIAAVWGCSGSIADETGELWLFTTPIVERVPIKFIKEARRSIEELLRIKRILVSAVLADYACAVKTYRLLGFALGAPKQYGSTGALFREIRLERGQRASPHVRSQATQPFIIYSLPRSRTAWLSAFLSYEDWTCFHERAMYMRGVDEIKALFSRQRIGSVETAAGQGWFLIHHYFPDIKAVVIRRPIEDVRASLLRGVDGLGLYNQEQLSQVLNYGDRMLDQIAKQPGVLTIAHEELDSEEGCRQIFEHCLPHKFDRAWWLSLKDKNIQINMPNMLHYYQRNREGIDGFKRACKMELSRLRRSGELRRGVGNR